MPDFPAFVTLEDQSSDCKPTQMLAGGLHLDVQPHGNILKRKIRLLQNQLKHFKASVIGKPLHYALKVMQPGCGTPLRYGSLRHFAIAAHRNHLVNNVLTFLRM